jgi:NTE family protein
MLFHVGALWRLNEAGYIPRLKRISSVSGGSITAGYLGFRWSRLEFNSGGVAAAFEPEFVAGIRRLARRTIDVRAGVRGLFTRGSIAHKIVDSYREHLFGNATLQDLPDDRQYPRFVINATNVQSGALWRFSRPYMRDWRVGKIASPKVDLAVAVAASSAFPPFLSPLRLPLNPNDFEPGSGEDLQREPYTRRALLTDGGVYDNLGLETAWKRYSVLLVSDGGGKMGSEKRPKKDWLRHTIRVLGVIDNQVRSLRKRDLIDLFEARESLIAAGLPAECEAVRRFSREGAFWGIRTNIADYKQADSLACPQHKTMVLAEEATRLAAVSELTQERLINWGYAVCDAAIRRNLDGGILPPDGFPYSGGVG